MTPSIARCERPRGMHASEMPPIVADAYISALGCSLAPTTAAASAIDPTSSNCSARDREMHACPSGHTDPRHGDAIASLANTSWIPTTAKPRPDGANSHSVNLRSTPSTGEMILEDYFPVDGVERRFTL